MDTAGPAGGWHVRAAFGMAVILACLAGCADFEAPSDGYCPSRPRSAVRVYGRTITELTYRAVDKMTLCLAPEIASSVPIVVTSLTDARRIDRSTTFGNIIADFARSRLAQDHMIVEEQRLRTSMLMKTDEGEMMLGRNPPTLVRPIPYSAILTGTYAVGEFDIFVDLKLIRSDNAQILSAADFVVRRSEEYDVLLNPPTGAP